MKKLINLIKEITEFPYIEEDNEVMDGSFALTPYMSRGLRGNGKVQKSVDYYACNLFVKDKRQLVTKTKEVWKKIQKQNGCICDDPDYTYEKEGKIWMSTLHIQMLEEEE